MRIIFTSPKPLIFRNFSKGCSDIPRNESNLRMISSPIFSAGFPLIPVPIKIDRSSASESASAPFSRSFPPGCVHFGSLIFFFAIFCHRFRNFLPLFLLDSGVSTSRLPANFSPRLDAEFSPRLALRPSSRQNACRVLVFANFSRAVFALCRQPPRYPSSIFLTASFTSVSMSIICSTLS